MWKDLALLARLGVIGLGALYTIGLLIVNIDLGRYGLLAVDLARPEYVMAGFLWAVLISPAFFGILMVLAHLKPSGLLKKWEMRERWERLELMVCKALVLLVTAALMPYLLLLTLGVFGSGESYRWQLLLWGVFVLLGNSLALFYCAHTSLVKYPRYKREVGGHPSLLMTLIESVPYATIFVLALTLYSLLLFPQLPRAFGGGKKPLVKLFLSNVSKVEWSELGLPVSETKNTVGPVSLLLANESTLIITRDERDLWASFGKKPSTASAVAIDRKLISAVVYLPGLQ